MKQLVPLVNTLEYVHDKKVLDAPNRVVPFPENWPRHTNGGQVCDVLQGPCACGAWHTLNEWVIRDGSVVDENVEVPF